MGENDITYEQMSELFGNRCPECILSIVYNGQLFCNCPLNLMERFTKVDRNTVICNHFHKKPKEENDGSE